MFKGTTIESMRFGVQITLGDATDDFYDFVMAKNEDFVAFPQNKLL